MLIIGTGGLTRDVVTSWEIDPGKRGIDLYFFDNVSHDKDLLYGRYKIYHTFEELEHHFATIDKMFVVCVGNPLKRKRLSDQVRRLGGNLGRYISFAGTVVNPETPLGPGTIIEPGVMVSKDVSIAEGVFVNAGAILGHDCVLGEYASIGPGCRILGRAEIGAFSYIGCNAVVMPDVKVGKKVRVGVGKIVSEDLPDGTKFM